MINRLSIKSIALALAVLLIAWMLFASLRGGAEEQTTQAEPSGVYVSAIQPISEAEAADLGDAGVVGGDLPAPFMSRPAVQPLTQVQNEELNNRFQQARQLHKSGDSAKAIELYQSLIQDFPSLVDPYLNLASLYAQSSRLEEARETLLAGFSANQKADMLYQSLKKIHGSIAANAYRKAVDTKSEIKLAQISLPFTDKIVTSLDQTNEIQALRSQIDQVRQQASTQLQDTSGQSELIKELESRLATMQTSSAAEQANFSKQQSSLEQEVTALKEQVAEQSQALLASQAAEREALARVVRAEQDAANQIASAKEELIKQQQSLAAAELLASEENAKRVKQQELEQAKQKEREQAIAAKAQADALAAANTKAKDAEADKRNAIAKVKSWANAWSDQDVDAYVAHYADDYTANATLSRQQWLAQRQVRLTNKKFIKVFVSEFVVKDLGEQISVTFSQRYQSNTMDDTVRKRLSFSKQSGDWATAKIVNERIVSR